jgi:hypothetical protein
MQNSAVRALLKVFSSFFVFFFLKKIFIMAHAIFEFGPRNLTNSGPLGVPVGRMLLDFELPDFFFFLKKKKEKSLLLRSPRKFPRYQKIPSMILLFCHPKRYAFWSGVVFCRFFSFLFVVGFYKLRGSCDLWQRRNALRKRPV